MAGADFVVRNHSVVEKFGREDNQRRGSNPLVKLLQTENAAS
jgi:hypothetical protein